MLSRIRVVSLSATLALLTFLPACTKSPTEPPVTIVTLSVTAAPATGSPSNPVSMELRAINAGGTQIWHCEGCGCGNGTCLTVLDPTGNVVALTDPKAPLPACPDGSIPLAPQGVLTNGFQFTGVLYVKDSPAYPTPTYAAPPGTYTVVASFGYTKAQWGEWMQTTRTTSFTWNP